ncbi:uncharacterized protein [Mytilus edulis]|uniref:uncharacterized protein n=1 Tax=Mytilus edulis TaxID=6550 RepID=UPI0039F03ECA
MASRSNENLNKELFISTRHSNVRQIADCLRRGADVNFCDSMGETSLHVAVTNGNQNVISELINGGADLNFAGRLGKTPLHYAAKIGSVNTTKELIQKGADIHLKDSNGNTALDLATEGDTEKFLKEHYEKDKYDKLSKELRELGLATVIDLQDLLHESFHRCFWNRVYLVGPYSVGKSCLAKILVGENIPEARHSTDGIWIYKGRAGMDVNKMEWVFFPKGDAITQVLTYMLMSMSTTEIQENLSSNEKTQKQYKRLDSVQISHRTPTYQNDLNDGENNTNADIILATGCKQIDSEKDTSEPSNDKEGQKIKIKRPSSIKVKDRDNLPADHRDDIPDDIPASADCYETSTQQKHIVSPDLAEIQHKKQNFSLSTEKSKHEWIQKAISGMSHEKIHELLVKAVEEGKYKEIIVPIDIWDFGGQKDYYMTHQLFITSRGIFVLMFNGCIDLNKYMPDLKFLPGHFGNPTVSVYLLHWVNSILTYCKRTHDGFPKIIFVATHKDEKWFKWTIENRRKQLQNQLQELFGLHAGFKHLEFKPLTFVNATNPDDPEIAELRRQLMKRATEHPRWGEPMPTRWIPLELQLAQTSADGFNIISLDDLRKLNSQNGSMELSEKQIETFLKVQHSLGKLLYFDVEYLRDFIIISPPYLVEVLRSIVTEQQFWPEGERFSKILTNLQEYGMIDKDDIYYLWGQDNFKHILQFKTYMLEILVHLDIITAPRTSFEDAISPIQNVSRFLLPCMITKGNDTNFLERFRQTNYSIVIAYTFVGKVIPPALYYRFLSSLITSWDIKNYKEKNRDNRMLFSDLAVVTVDAFHDVAVQVDANRVIVSLIHASKKENIIPTLASSVQECLTAAILRISEFYSKLSEDVTSADCSSDMPFNIEFGVFCQSDICFFNHKDMPLSGDEPRWHCSKHKELHKTKFLTTWFSEKEPCDVCESSCKGLGTLERDLHPLQHHISRLATQLSMDDCREIFVMLGSSALEWGDIEYQFQHQLPNDIKFTALWSTTRKQQDFTFDSLQKVLEERGLSKHLLCQVFRDAIKHKSDMTEDALNAVPPVDALRLLSEHIGYSIMQLAIELGVDISTIQEIQHNHKNNLKVQIKTILMKWRKNNFPKPTVERLLKAFDRVGKYATAYSVLKGYF